MTAVSQSYPNYLGGLNEQPDELKKPGQLVEALNVIPDPVIGLTRRPGFELLPWKNHKGEPEEDRDIDLRGTWFEFNLENPENDDYIYIGCIDPLTGRVNIFNQDGEFQIVKYTSTSIAPHEKYNFRSSDNTVVIRDKNGRICMVLSVLMITIVVT